MTTASIAAADAALHPPGMPGVGELSALVEGALAGLGRADWWIPGPRERGAAVVRGVPIHRLTVDSDGRGGLHAALRSYKVGPSGSLRALSAVGLALAQPDRAALVHLGVGNAADGVFAEALNLAALRSARVIFVLAWRSLEGAPVPAQLACPPEALAMAYGVTAVRVDGRSAAAVQAAVQAARAQSGPTLVIADLG